MNNAAASLSRKALTAPISSVCQDRRTRQVVDRLSTSPQRAFNGVTVQKTFRLEARVIRYGKSLYW